MRAGQLLWLQRVDQTQLIKSCRLNKSSTLNIDYHISLHLTNCNHWIFDAAIDQAKTSWGYLQSLGRGEFSPERYLDNILVKTFIHEDCTLESSKLNRQES